MPRSLPNRLRRRVRGSDRLTLLVVAANLAGFLFGLHYYREQLLTTDWYLLPLVPDSATAVLLVATALLLQRAGRPHRALNYLAGCLAVTYGTWTLTILVLAPEHYFTPLWSDWFLFNALLIAPPHAAMVLETALLDLEPLGSREFLGVGALLLVNWVADYGLGTHTPIPDDILPAAATAALALITVTVLALGPVHNRLLRER